MIKYKIFDRNESVFSHVSTNLFGSVNINKRKYDYPNDVYNDIQNFINSPKIEFISIVGSLDMYNDFGHIVVWYKDK